MRPDRLDSIAGPLDKATPELPAAAIVPEYAAVAGFDMQLWRGNPGSAFRRYGVRAAVGMASILTFDSVAASLPARSRLVSDRPDIGGLLDPPGH